VVDTVPEQLQLDFQPFFLGLIPLGCVECPKGYHASLGAVVFDEEDHLLPALNRSPRRSICDLLNGIADAFIVVNMGNT